MVRMVATPNFPYIDTNGTSVDRGTLMCLPRLYRLASQMMIPARSASKTTSSDFPVKGIAAILVTFRAKIAPSCKANTRQVKLSRLRADRRRPDAHGVVRVPCKVPVAKFRSP